MNSEDSNIQLACSVIGKTIREIHRLFYLHNGHLDTTEGALQLTFTDNSFLLLDSGVDGDSLRVSLSNWVDPFSVNPNKDNDAFIKTHGQWVLVDVSNYSPFNELIGKHIHEVAPTYNNFSKINGITASIDGLKLKFWVEADACKVAT